MHFHLSCGLKYYYPAADDLLLFLLWWSGVYKCFKFTYSRKLGSFHLGFLPLVFHFLERASLLWFIQSFAYLFLAILGSCYYGLNVKWLPQVQEHFVPS